MATDSSNSTSNSSYEKTIAYLPELDCILWLVVGITECLAIVILNIIAIIVFVRQRQVQRRSTYLIIHLAVVDFLFGAVSAPLATEEELGKYCNLWEFNLDIYYLKYPLRYLFPLTSLGNLALIAFERAHATYRPFKHRFVKKKVYGVIIFATWLITTSMVSVQLVFYYRKGLDFATSVMNFMYFLYLSICLLIIFFCYVFIFIKVRCGRHRQCRGTAISRERKLTSTLLLVTLASLLSWLPYAIFRRMSSSFHYRGNSNLPLRSPYSHIEMALLMLLGANSLVNPLVYILRMPEFRVGIAKLFHKDQSNTNHAVTPLENLER